MAHLTDDEKFLLSILNSACDKSTGYASRVFKQETGNPIDRVTIKNNWKKLKLPIASCGGARVERHPDEVREAEAQTGGDFMAMVDYLNLDPKTLKQLCTKYSIYPKNILPSLDPSRLAKKVIAVGISDEERNSQFFKKQRSDRLIGCFASEGGNVRAAIETYNNAFRKTLGFKEFSFDQAMLELGIREVLNSSKYVRARKVIERKLEFYKVYVLAGEDFNKMLRYFGGDTSKLVKECNYNRTIPINSPPELVLPKKGKYTLTSEGSAWSLKGRRRTGKNNVCGGD